MTYQSVDALQKTLADSVFEYATDRKKAAGRALGTLVEIITFYTLRSWGFRDHVVIERPVPEFANPNIVHNVEFSLHRILAKKGIYRTSMALPLTTAQLKRRVQSLSNADLKSTQLLTSGRVKRNSCVIRDNETEITVANLNSYKESNQHIVLCSLAPSPFAIFECKRVGVEEGMRKGPQTIEKAKQGAYVARTISSLQKFRRRNGQFQGIIELEDGTLRENLYTELLRELIDSPEMSPPGFILTVGVVSNHGNWFTSDDPNKELQVLSQSYDWLLFLTDAGLSQFIDELLLSPTPSFAPARDAFLASYSGRRGANRFTKVQMGLDADVALWNYFTSHAASVGSWFNVIAPSYGSVAVLRTDLQKLANKSLEGE